jgi:hypothetical protein
MLQLGFRFVKRERIKVNGRSGAGGSEGQLLLDKDRNFAYLIFHRERAAAG